MASHVQERTGTFALGAILLAIGGFVMTLAGSPMWGLLAHILTVVLGAIGLTMAASPRVTGGFMSMGAIVMAVFGIGLDVLVLIGTLAF